MTLIERAKALMNASASAALVAVPLAAAVTSSPAAAAVVLPTSAINDTGGMIDELDIHGTALPGGGTAFVGGSPAVLFSSGSSGSVYQEGTLNESFNGRIDVAYKFNMVWRDVNDEYNITTPTDWSVVLSVGQTGQQPFAQTIHGVNGVFEGSTSLTGVHLDAGATTRVSFASLIGASSTGPTIRFNLGGGYINFNPVAAPLPEPEVSPVPEPETWAMFGSGLLVLMARRRRSR